MSTLLAIDELLEPISPNQPAGEEVRWTPEWDRVKEARRADDALEAGKWRRKEQKSADWRLVQELTTAMLQKRSKDLQLAMWLTEANVKLNGFQGLRDGFYLIGQLMIRFWDRGLFPLLEDGPEDRAGPFDWMNEKLVDSLLDVPVTRSQRVEDFSLLQLRDARLVGSESSWKDNDGNIEDEKKKAFDKAIAEGRRSLDTFRSAVASTPRAVYESLASEFLAAHEEFRSLEKTVDEKFGGAAPSLKDMRAVMNEIAEEIQRGLSEKRLQEPNASSAPHASDAEQSAVRPDSIKIRLPLSGFTTSGAQPASNASWQEAERLVRSGQVDAGLAEMMRLAAGETSGRSRFQRKLLLAEVCLSGNRPRLARTILEELAEQIDKLQLEAWEGSDVIGGVWTRLYQMYSASDSSDKERAAKLFDRLCRLDPWQALACGE